MASALPATTPRIAWELEAGAPLNSSPAVVDGTVFQGTAKGTMWAVDLGAGTTRWQRALEGALTSPTVVGDVVVVGSTEGLLTGLDREIGAVRWQFALKGEVRGAPAIDGTAAVVASTTGEVMDVLAADGTVRWTTNVAGAAARSVAIADGVAVVPVQPGALVALDVASGKQMWRAKLAQEGGVGTPVIDRGRVMTATGLDDAAPANRAVVALDLRTGKPDWTWYSPTGERVYTPAVRGDRAYVVSEAGYVVALDVATGTEAWRAPTSGPIEANAATTEDGVIAADNGGSLLALAPGDGSVLWQAPIQGVPYAPVVACGLVLVPSGLGALTAFGAP